MVTDFYIAINTVPDVYMLLGSRADPRNPPGFMTSTTAFANVVSIQAPLLTICFVKGPVTQVVTSIDCLLAHARTAITIC